MKVYCIGIGGIGLSALARYYKSLGHEVLGSDSQDSELIAELRKEGMPVSIGADSSHITDDIDLVVFTIAISTANAEFMRANELGLRNISYPQALGELTATKKTIAVCGTHGKTTTTALMYYALKACGINPSVIIGSLLSEGGLNATGNSVASPDQAKLGLRTNFIAGDSEYLVVEACEYKRSFLNLHPTHIIVTNIDADHLDYYRDLKDIYEAFQTFAHKLLGTGTLVTHRDIFLETQAKKVNADYIDKESIDLTIWGDHQKQNAQLVLALVEALGLDVEKARLGMKGFTGTWRRMEYKGRTSTGVMVYDDYGHHPTEIRATLDALRTKYPKGEYKIHVFFQPHLHSRTKAFFEEFGEVLKDADFVTLMPIYKARLETDLSVTSEHVRDLIVHKGGYAESLPSIADMPARIEAIADPYTIVLNIGAGDAFAELDKLHLEK